MRDPKATGTETGTGTHPTVCSGLTQKWNVSVASSLLTTGTLMNVDEVLHDCLLCMTAHLTDGRTFLVY